MRGERADGGPPLPLMWDLCAMRLVTSDPIVDHPLRTRRRIVAILTHPVCAPAKAGAQYWVPAFAGIQGGKCRNGISTDFILLPPAEECFGSCGLAGPRIESGVTEDEKGR